MKYLQNRKIYIRCFSIWPSASISISSVSIVSFFRSNSKSSFWPEVLISSGLKLVIPASKRHMLYNSVQFPFGSKKVHFRPESVQEKHQQLKTHELKSEVTVKDEDQIDSHLIIECLLINNLSFNRRIFKKKKHSQK